MKTTRKIKRLKREEKLRIRNKDKPLLFCDTCGLAKADVKRCFNPFNEEVYNEKIPTNLCDECYREAQRDV